MPISIVIHVFLGMVLGIVFMAASLSKFKMNRKVVDAGSRSRAKFILENILFVGVAVATLLLVMKFVRDYEPRYWVNIISLVISWAVSWYVSWRILFRSKGWGKGSSRSE